MLDSDTFSIEWNDNEMNGPLQAVLVLILLLLFELRLLLLLLLLLLLFLLLLLKVFYFCKIFEFRNLATMLFNSFEKFLEAQGVLVKECKFRP